MNFAVENLGGYGKHTLVKSVQLFPITGQCCAGKSAWKLIRSIVITIGDTVSMWEGKNDVFVVIMIILKKSGRRQTL